MNPVLKISLILLSIIYEGLLCGNHFFGDTELILDKVVSVFVLGALYGDLGNTQRNTQFRTVCVGKASVGCCENVRCRPCHPQRAETGSRANCSQGRACCGWGVVSGCEDGQGGRALVALVLE